MFLILLFLSDSRLLALRCLFSVQRGLKAELFEPVSSAVKERYAHVNSLLCQKNVLNSNHAALTSACDSEGEIGLVRFGDTKADGVKWDTECAGNQK